MRDRVHVLRHLALCAAVLVLILLTHLPLRKAEYIQDDHLAVEKNPVVERGDLGEIFTSSYWAGATGDQGTLYRPMVILSFAVERYWTGEPDARMSHGINLALHALVAFSLFVLTLRLGGKTFAAISAAMLFAVHPIHVEAVGRVVGRADLLAALFTLLALIALTAVAPSTSAEIPRTARGVARARATSWIAGSFTFLALCSKESAIAAIPLALILELCLRPPGRGGSRRSWLIDRAVLLAPTALAFLLYAAMRIHALETLSAVQAIPPVDNYLVLLGGLARIATALKVLARYAALLIYPYGLTADYSGYAVPPESRLLSPGPALGILVLALWVLLAFAPLLRWPTFRVLRWHPAPAGTGRQVSVAASLFLFPYLVIGNLIVPVGAVCAERFLYLPAAGFCALLGLLLARLYESYPAFQHWSDVQRRRMVGAILAILLGAFALLCWQRCLDWRNDETLFRAAIRANPDAPRAHFIVAGILAARGDEDEAMENLQRTVDLWPDYPPAWYREGILFGRRGNLASAEMAFRAAIRYLPSYAKAHMNLGFTLYRLGRKGEAERSLRKALIHDPTLDRGWEALGHILEETGRYDAAASAYARAVALGRPDLNRRVEFLRGRAESVQR